MIGRTISHYKIVAKLGQGGMGEVYKADDLRLHRPVALKFLPLDAITGEEERIRFEREARAAASLDHPNICTVYEIDTVEGRPFISMGYLEGQTIQQRVQAGPVAIDEAVDFAMQAARGLAAAHEKGIVHRDIKSANLMLIQPGAGSDQQVKIMDFGLAQLALAGSKLTHEGTTLGTASYMSPEQARGEKVDHRSDLWALGVVLHEMITGQLPFPGDYPQAVIYSILHEEPAAITSLRSGVGLELERIVHKCLAKDPGERYQSALDLLADLRALKRQRDSAASQGQSVPGIAVTRQQPASADSVSPPRNWLRWLGIIAAALLLAAVFAPRVLQPPPGPPPSAFQIKPLTSYPGTEVFPTFSPDGNQVAFSWNGESQDNFDIYVRLVEGGGPVRLTDHPAEDNSPAWSTDNRHIAFLRHEAGRSSVYIVPPFGGKERKLAELRMGSRNISRRNLAWSPDGEFLAFIDRGRQRRPGGIFLLNPDTGDRTLLLHSEVPGPGAHSLAFSPDGRSLAFVRPSSPSPAIFL